MESIQPETVPELTEVESDLDNELTALEYARTHSIALDHLNPDMPLTDLRLAHEHHTSIPSNQAATALEDGELASVSTLIPPGFKVPQESLSICKESLPLLAAFSETIAGSSKNESCEIEEITDRLLCVKSKGTVCEKLELPVLRSDHELDVASWGGREEAVLEDLNLPREPIDEGSGKGLAWGGKVMGEVGRIEQGIQRERLVVDAEIAGFLFGVMRDEWCEDGKREVWEREICYKRVSLHFTSFYR